MESQKIKQEMLEIGVGVKHRVENTGKKIVFIEYKLVYIW